MLHNASLLIDDIEDNSKLRRGIPVAHSIYGVAHTINSANYIYFLGLQKVLMLEHPEATKVFTEQLLELHRGQGMDIYWRDSVVCPTEEEYNTMVIRTLLVHIARSMHSNPYNSHNYFIKDFISLLLMCAFMFCLEMLKNTKLNKMINIICQF
ncbi:GGPS1 [Mytilus edulis]|uniref:GGPS1 n=1 Tax=Mytilus edulis TaxID=6550 RepID=A0A8S3QB00_MYTED|nr:GGPS1 [Mytilus edulis]